MSVKCWSRVLCQKAVLYKLYKGLIFTTIWLETTSFKRKCWRLCYFGRAFLFRGGWIYAEYKRMCKCVPSTFKYWIWDCIDLFISHDTDDKYLCRPFFPEDKKDYTKNQASWTMLYKKKCNLNTGEKTILYDRLKK